MKIFAFILLISLPHHSFSHDNIWPFLLAVFFNQDIDLFESNADKESIKMFEFYTEDVGRIIKITKPDLIDVSILDAASSFASKTTREYHQFLNICWSEV
jgi:hypothetical protein